MPSSEVKKKRVTGIPGQLTLHYFGLTEATDAFCSAHLTDEYAALCRELAAALCRKRPSPVLNGTLPVWSAAIVYVLGGANFLHDPSQTPYMKLADIGPRFGVSNSGTQAKAKQIRDMFRIGQMDPRWSLPSRLAENPLAWFIKVDGFVIDARQAPREIQEAAFKQGLIPFLPS
jgi:hypothetical protein